MPRTYTRTAYRIVDDTGRTHDAVGTYVAARRLADWLTRTTLRPHHVAPFTTPIRSI